MKEIALWVRVSIDSETAGWAIIDSNAPQYKYANIVNFVLAPFRNEFLHQLISKLTSQGENKEWNCKNMGIEKLAIMPILPFFAELAKKT